MSNLTSFSLASIFSLLSIWAFYFLIKKWPQFHVSLLGKGLKIIYALILFYAVTLSLVLAYDYFQAYWEDDRVRVVTEFQGVQLGWSKDELSFRHGEATSSDEENDNNNDTFLTYENFGVSLINDKVVKVIYPCDSGIYDFQKVGGISCGDNVDRVTSQYGLANSILISEDKLSRIYNYPKYNLAFVLSKSKVEMLAIFDPRVIPNGLQYATQSKALVEPQSEPKSSWENNPIVPESDINKTEDEKPWLKYSNPTIEEIENAGKEKAVSKEEWKQAKSVNKNIDYEKLAAENDSINSEFDHCAPNLTKSERLRRLALRGTVRETRENGYQSYTVRNYEITFSDEVVISCNS